MGAYHGAYSPMLDVRPGVAYADPKDRSPFHELLLHASKEIEWTKALAFAYCDLPCDARKALIEEVVQGCRSLGVVPGPLLLGLLAVEEDQNTAAIIAQWLRFFESDTAARNDSFVHSVVLRIMHSMDCASVRRCPRHALCCGLRKSFHALLPWPQ